jgi:hypothetical protein
LAPVAAPHAVLALRILLADEHGQERVVPQVIVVVDVFLAKAQAEEALLEQFRQRVLNQVGIPVVRETAGELLDEVKVVLDLAE